MFYCSVYKIEFNKDTRKCRRQNEEVDGDVEMVDGKVHEEL